MLRTKAVLLCGAVLAVTSAALAQHGGGPVAIEVPEKGASLAMLDFGGRTVVDAKINGRGPYRFVLGTAATMTIIDASLHRELSFPIAEGVPVAPVGGQAPLIVKVQELRLGGAVVRGFIAAVMPLSNFQRGESMPRGIISASLFQGYLLTYNYPRNRIFIEQGKLEIADSQSIFEYAGSRPSVPIKIAGQEAYVRLDTGSSHGLTLPARFQKELPLASPPTDAGKTRTVAGDFPVAKARVQGVLKIGQYRVEEPEVYFSDAGPGAPVGNIGYEVLRNFVVTLDTWNRRVRLTR